MSTKSKSKTTAKDIAETLETSSRNRNLDFCSTGADLLDLVVGGGLGEGFIFGKVVNVVGDKSAGKTFVTLEMLAKAIHKYGPNLAYEFDDAEEGFSFDTTSLYNLKIEPREEKSNTAEELYINIRRFAERMKPEHTHGIYIVDSFDAIGSEAGDKAADDRYSAAEAGKDYDQGSYNTDKQRYLSREFFPQVLRIIAEKNILLVVLSQVRMNLTPGAFEKFVRNGGKAFDHDCHTVIWLANTTKIKKKDRVIGYIVHAKATKSKTPRPYRECDFIIYFDYGVDNISSNLDFYFNTRTDTGQLASSAQKLIWDDGSLIDENAANVKEWLAKYREENPDKKDRLGEKPGMKDIIAWARANPEANASYEKSFGTQRTYDEMIQFIIDNKLQGELKRRVVAEWEAIEESLRITRPAKYAEAAS